jgi:hypothetical protein
MGAIHVESCGSIRRMSDLRRVGIQVWNGKDAQPTACSARMSAGFDDFVMTV